MPYSLTTRVIMEERKSRGTSVFLKNCIDIGMSMTRNNACKKVILMCSGVSSSKKTGYCSHMLK